MTTNDQTTRDAAIAEAAGVDADTVQRLLYDYDWPNAEEHAEWAQTAPVAEIASWLAAIVRDEQDA